MVPIWRRLLPPGLRRAVHGARHDLQQHLVGRRRHRRCRPPSASAVAVLADRSQGREHGQVADLPADGDLVRRRRDHLALHVPSPDTAERPDRRAQRDLGVARRGQHVGHGQDRSPSSSSASFAVALGLPGHAGVEGQAGDDGRHRRSASCVHRLLPHLPVHRPGPRRVRGGRTARSGADRSCSSRRPPFNNMWLMVILIWIQTGFAMVILSAAIKAVPHGADRGGARSTAPPRPRCSGGSPCRRSPRPSASSSRR